MAGPESPALQAPIPPNKFILPYVDVYAQMQEKPLILNSVPNPPQEDHLSIHRRRDRRVTPYISESITLA